MSPHLKKAIRDLRSQRCPARVLDAARAQIHTQRRPWNRQLGLRLMLWTAPALLLVAVAITRWSPVSFAPDLAGDGAAPEISNSRMLKETHLSLAYIGSSFIDAGHRTETVLVQHVQPRLLDSLNRAAEALSHASNPP